VNPQPARTENLALIFQDLITIGARLRCKRVPIVDVVVFRKQIVQACRYVHEQARKQGYSQEDIELAMFGVVAFLDESVFNCDQPMFEQWARQPLQSQLYGWMLAGDVFFQNLRKLLSLADSVQIGDVLEVYYLCLLLGFKGRYSQGRADELQSIMQETADKFRRIRQIAAVLSPDAMPQDAPVLQTSADPLARILLVATIFLVVAAIASFVTFYFLLGKGVRTLERASGAAVQTIGAVNGEGASFREHCRRRG
jgi:type VI secretion system protein ImpK